jgi:hypothetical protein
LWIKFEFPSPDDFFLWLQFHLLVDVIYEMKTILRSPYAILLKLCNFEEISKGTMLEKYKLFTGCHVPLTIFSFVLLLREKLSICLYCAETKSFSLNFQLLSSSHHLCVGSHSGKWWQIMRKIFNNRRKIPQFKFCVDEKFQISVRLPFFFIHLLEWITKRGIYIVEEENIHCGCHGKTSENFSCSLDYYV